MWRHLVLATSISEKSPTVNHVSWNPAVGKHPALGSGRTLGTAEPWVLGHRQGLCTQDPGSELLTEAGMQGSSGASSCPLTTKAHILQLPITPFTRKLPDCRRPALSRIPESCGCQNAVPMSPPQPGLRDRVQADLLAAGGLFGAARYRFNSWN